MKGMKIIATLSIIIVIIVFITLLKELSLIEPKYFEYIKYAYALIILIGGIIITRQLSSLSVEILKTKLKEQSLIVGNIILIIGYIISISASISYIGSIPEVLLAGATFSGLIIGLAAQPVLS
ncbi:MAG: hypothetical protein ACP5IZ_11085, partial [Thermoprotei archaeon]